MKTILSVFVILAAVAGGVMYVAPWSQDFANQTISDADGAFRDGVRDDTVSDGAQQELAKIQIDLKTKYAEVISAKQTLADQQSKRDSHLKDLSKQEAVIAKALAWLDAHKPGDEMEVGGKTYSYEVVATDARTRVAKCEGLRSTIKAFEESCAVLASAITDAEGKIRESLTLVQQRQGEIVAKKVQLAAWRTIEATNQLAQGLNFDSIGSQDGTTRYLNELDRRIDQAKANHAIEDMTSFDGGVVNWNSDQAIGTTDLSDIKAYQSRHLETGDEDDLGDALEESVTE